MAIMSLLVFLESYSETGPVLQLLDKERPGENSCWLCKTKHLGAQSGHLPEAEVSLVGRVADRSVDMETASHCSRILWAFGLYWIPGSAWGWVGGGGQLIGFGWAESSFQHFWLSPEERAF